MKKKSIKHPNDEASFLTSFKKSLDFGHYHKIMDTPVFSGGRMRFTRNKPYDGYLMHQGVFAAIEGKYHKGAGAWSLSNIQSHQREALAEVEKEGGLGLVLLFFKLPLKNRRYERWAYAIRYSDLIAFSRKAARKSVPVSQFETLSVVGAIPYITETGLWNLSEFRKYLQEIPAHS